MNMKIDPINPADVQKTAGTMKNGGYRLVVVTCTPADEGYYITYSFEKETDLRHYRITVAKGMKIPSIGSSYGGAFVYENEIHDLYGFEFEGMSLDFGGTFIKTSVPYPFKKKEQPAPSVTVVKEAKE
ncbi:NADH-quinone oxidoreductase subunit C [uncultured Methanocorpusculum sp.]|nr:NADH-quinone oxidoreductase subunit C [uncultured Methanocorpusculum sp.]